MSRTESLEKAIGLAQRLRHVFVATADRAALPHVARRLIVRVDRILDFHPAPHSDIEE